MAQNKPQRNQQPLKSEPSTEVTTMENTGVIVEEVNEPTTTTPTFFLDDVVNDQRLTDTLNVLVTYVEESYDSFTIGLAQQQLYNHIHRTLLRGNSDEIRCFFDKLLTFIHEHSSNGMHFTATRCYTGFRELKMTQPQFNEFKMILCILMDTANPVTRAAAAKKVMWDNVIRSFSPTHGETLISNLKDYYGVE